MLEPATSLSDSPRLTLDLSKEGMLLRQARKGDKHGFDKLREHFDPDLRRFLLRFVGEHDVQDVIQETWIAVWTAMDKFQDRSSFRTWVFGIGIRKAKDMYRQRARTTRNDALDEVRDFGASDPTESAEQKIIVEQIMDSLSMPDRTIFELYYFVQLSLPEIASTLKLNLNTLKYRFYAAHKKVEAQISQQTSGFSGASRGMK